MAQPTAYQPAHEFWNDEGINPNFPGSELDIEFAALDITLTQILANLALIQRDDGALANQSVGLDQLTTAVRAMIGDIETLEELEEALASIDDSVAAAAASAAAAEALLASVVVGPAASADGEIALFDAATGKLLKRATTTGLLKAAAGVLSPAAAGVDYSAPSPTNVRTQGAVGDYDPITTTGADDTAAFEAAIAAALATGGSVIVPAGSYKITSELTIDVSGLPSFVEGRIGFEGEGSASAHIYAVLSSGETLLSFVGGDFGTAAQWARFRLAGVHLVGVGDASTNGITGLDIDHAILVEKQDVEISQFYQAEKCRDVVGMSQTFCRWTYNNYGQLFDDDWTDSAVNEVTSVGCHWLNNRQYGFWANTGGNHTFVGGSCESNGKQGVWTEDTSRWGMRFTNCGQFSVVAFAMNGVHFEANANEADVWIEHDDWPTVYSLNGVDFFRIDSTDYVTNNIRFETTGSTAAHLMLTGCGFHGVNSYVADAGRRRIAYGSVTGSLHKITTIGCVGLSESLTDAPTMLGGDGNAFSATTECQVFRVPFANTSAVMAALDDNGANPGPYITTRRRSASPALLDALGGLASLGSDSAGNDVLYGRIVNYILDPTTTAYDGWWSFDVPVNGVMTVGAQIGAGVSVGTSQPGAGKVNVLTEYQVNTAKVVGARKTGWTVPTGTATRTAFATGSVTLPELAERVKALIDDLHATAGHGLLGA